MGREEPAASETKEEPTDSQWKEWSNQRNDPDFKFHRKRQSLAQKGDVDMSLDHIYNDDEVKERQQMAANMHQKQSSEVDTTIDHVTNTDEIEEEKKKNP